MADISKLEQQADLLFNNVAGWEQSTLQRIGKRIGKYGKMSLADVKAINNIAVVKQDMDAITKELARVTGYNISQIEQMYGELLEEQHLANQPLYDYRGKKFVPFAENRELQAIARAYAKTTGETMINLSRTKALRILDKNGNKIGMQRYFTDVLDKAVVQVASGATDFHTAMRDSIVELGGSGVRVDYGEKVINGKKVPITRRLDSVVRQNLLDGAKQASIAYNELIYDELGCTGYEVDAHSSPRPSHMFVQGKQYCIGKSRTINGIKFIGFEETDPTSEDNLSASQALSQYGCLHHKTPILCGISEPRFSKEQLAQIEADNKKQYKVGNLEGNKYFFSQKMRNLETAIREQKRIEATAKASGFTNEAKEARAKIKAYRQKYDEIAETTGLYADTKRMSVPRKPKT